MANKAWSTQHLANAFPSWSRIRDDEQSLGRQFLNTIGHSIDDISKQISRIGDNYFLPTSIVSDIDVYYQFRLPGNFSFTKEEDDDTEFLYTPPTVSGIIDNQLYAISMATNNDIESFWYDAIPDRWDLGTVSSGEHVIASGYVYLSPLSPLTISGIIDVPNYLTIVMSGGSSYIGIEDRNLVRKGLVQIEGTTRAGLELTEEIIFIHDDVAQTQWEYSRITTSGIRIFGINDREDTHITVTAGAFNRPEYQTAYDLTTNLTDEDIPAFWALGSGYSAGIYTLDLRQSISPLELRIEGFTDKETILQQELRTYSGINIVPMDMAVEPRSEHLWVVDTNNLYLFNDNLSCADCSLFEQKNYDASCVIEPETYYATYGQSVSLDFTWMRPVIGLVRHRAWVVKPDGTKYLLTESGSETAWDSSAWVYGEPHGRKMRPTATFTLDQRGQYTYSLEAMYTDGTSSIDQKAILVVYKDAIKDFSLESISSINGAIIGIDIDSENNIWVLDNAGIKYRIDLHYDNMIIDFAKKIIYFREPYDTVRVIE